MIILKYLLIFKFRSNLGEEQASQLERGLRICCDEGSVTYTTQTMNHVQNELLVQVLGFCKKPIAVGL